MQWEARRGWDVSRPSKSGPLLQATGSLHFMRRFNSWLIQERTSPPNASMASVRRWLDTTLESSQDLM